MCKWSVEASLSTQIHLTVEPQVFVYGLGGRANLLFITACLIPGPYYQSVIRNTKVHKKEHSCISPQKFVILPTDYSWTCCDFYVFVCALCWLSSLGWSPGKGHVSSWQQVNFGEECTCRSGARFSFGISWHLVHWRPTNFQQWKSGLLLPLVHVNLLLPSRYLDKRKIQGHEY